MHSIKNVITECRSYIQTLRKGEKGCFLVRSIHDDIDIQRFDHSTHERTPLNMDQSVHKAVNQHFLNIFKWQVRNGVFCFGVKDPSHMMAGLGYGRMHLMFPCGEFEYVCDHEIFDLYAHYRDFLILEPKAELSEFIGSINYSNISLEDVMSRVSAFNRSAEIIINCQTYYLVNLRYIDTLSDIIWIRELTGS
jgi:hypothetical protein